MGFDPISIGAALLTGSQAATVGAAGIGSTLATAATIGATALSAVGAISQSRASAASAGYNAQVAQNNAQIATQNSQFAGAEGEQNVSASTAKTRALVGATLANQGASGVDVNSGSSVNVRESEAKIGALNALNIRSQAARSAYGYQVGATSDEAQAALLRSQKKNDITAGYLDAGATVLGGLGKASQYTRWLSAGGI